MPGPPKKTDSSKKRYRAEKERVRRGRLVNIGDVVDEWKAAKDESGLQTDAELARKLIDTYKESKKKKRKIAASTPAAGPQMEFAGWSSSGSISSVRGSLMSGLEELPDSPQIESETSQKGIQGEKNIPHMTAANISIEEVTISDLDAGAIEDSDDELYVPSLWEMSLSVPDPKVGEDQMLEEVGDVAALVHDINMSDMEEDDEPPETNITKLMQISRSDLDDPMFLVSESCLFKLAALVPIKRCPECQGDVAITSRKNGSGVFLDWACGQKHIAFSWASQSLLKYGVMLGNMKLNTAITLSGNNYQKVALLCSFLNLGIPSHYTFNQVQSNFIAPEVGRFWTRVKETAQEETRGVDVVVAGDGRMDSPGYCAKYCTYTMMDQKTKKIVAMEIIDKRECQLVSGRMEAVGFQRALRDLDDAGVTMTECVTDAHPQIASLMRKNYPGIRHSWDMWHGAKNFGKKLCAVSQEKGKAALKPWITPITNHFYYAAEHCDNDELNLKVSLASILNHCANRHEWALGECAHGELDEDERDKEWLDPAGPELKALEKVVLNPRFLGTLHHYVTCQTTSELESFNNHILMYAAKRQAFSYTMYKCRCQLAATDYMMHLDRPYKKNKKGEQW